MAKKKQTKKTKTSTEATARPSRFWRYFFVIGMTGVILLVWISLLSYSPNDPPVNRVYEAGRPLDNHAGIVGAYLSYYLHHYLGGGVYMALLFATVSAVILLSGGRINELPWRLTGVALMVVTTSAAIYLLNPGAARELDSGSAGVLGVGVGGFLQSKLGNTSWLAIIAVFCIGLVFTADHLVMQLPRIGKKLWQNRPELPNVAEMLRARRTAVADGKDTASITASPRAVAAAPARATLKAKEPPASPAAEPEKPRVRILTEATKPLEPKAAPKPAPKKTAPRPTADKDDKKADPRDYEIPSADLLAEPVGGYIESQEAQAAQQRAVLQQTLNDFNVAAEVVGHMTGPVITMFELSLAPGVKVAQVHSLGNDIARALAVPGVRVVSPLPGRDTIGIEVPNADKEIVRIKELMNLAPEAEKKMFLPLYLGKDAGGNPIVADLGGMPHMLMAGTTGSGKSVSINSIIMSLLLTRTPEQVRLILVDPKMVEMAAFENIPHLLCPIVNDMHKAEDILEWAATKMDERYELLKEANVKNIAGYNKLDEKELYARIGVETDEEKARIPAKLPYYVIIIDELADLIMTSSKEVESHIIRIAQKARAVGIHLILATQRPSVNVVTGLIKSNMPCRVSFRVASRQESRIVLDQNGADVLLGQGDMLFLQPGTSNLVRAQGTYIDDSEIHTVVDTLRKSGEPQYNTELMRLNSAPSGELSADRDELFDQAVEIVLASQRGSVSLLQRRLSIGYSRASRIIDQMADAGLLGDYKGSQARECLITLDEWEGMKQGIADDLSGASAANGEPTSV